MRRYDLDSLRVIVFGLLIFYHVGMFFVPWDFHIKNDIIYPSIKWPMLFLNQWRLPILFVISGMGTYYALSKRTGSQFSKERLKRLLIPLVAGMILIVPPQIFFERLDQGIFAGNYLEFWPVHAFIGIYPEGNISWNHLWFLPYLLIFSLLLTPVFLYLRNNPHARLLRYVRKVAVKPFGLFLFILPLYIWEAFLEPRFPSTHALLGDWFNLINYLTYFFYGFILISIKEIFWKTVHTHRRQYLYCGILSFTLLLGRWLIFEDSVIVHYVEAGIKIFNLWAWILVLFGYSATYLNQSSTKLSYANEAVYPFYILHQTITIAIGYYLMHLEWGFWTKFSIMVIGTFSISWIIYEYFIRRWNWVRPIFGLKTIKKEDRNYNTYLPLKLNFLKNTNSQTEVVPKENSVL